ncbi:MAG: hypothetical protein JWQ66_1774 [Mucilaginibacter sp.]|nr:hypothetical protein [Mucilaginibacter sp.]
MSPIKPIGALQGLVAFVGIESTLTIMNFTVHWDS